MIKLFKKESMVLRQKITTRMLIISLAIIALAVSGTVLMAGWLDDNPAIPGQVLYTDPANGNVGIGTDSPQAKLHLSGDFSQKIPMQINNETAIENIAISCNLNNILTSWIGYGAICLKTQSTSLSRIWLDGRLENSRSWFLGTVGFGITAPSRDYKIHVVGNALIAGTTTSTNYACSSDVRYKKDVSPYQNALQKVLGLQGVNYFWKTDEYKEKNFNKDKQIGFIAQEVEKVIPELVYTDDKGFKTMSYDRLTAVIVEAIKELNTKSDAKISALEKENTELKQRLAKLDSVAERLAKLEKVVESTQFAQK